MIVDRTLYLPMVGTITIAFFSAYLFSWVARFTARHLGFCDRPTCARKSHCRETPLLGGVAVFVAIVIAFAVCRFVVARNTAVGGAMLADKWMMIVPAALLCLLGLWDDKHPLRARTKLILQTAACLPFCFTLGSIESVDILNHSVQLGWLAPWASLTWLLACVNSVNFLDGEDGLAGSFGVVVALTVIVLGAMSGALGTAMLATIVVASLLGFLLHNWTPAKIFLGDAGSLTLGYLLGAMLIDSARNIHGELALAVPLIVMSVPLFDTFVAILRRVLTGTGIAAPDRLHIHHRLRARGMTSGLAVVSIAVLCAIMALASIGSMYLGNAPIGWGICAAVLSLLVIFRVFGYQELRLAMEKMGVVRPRRKEPRTIEWPPIRAR